ncbi:MAG: glycosyltransferase, partial [Nitrospiria bacterium]
MASGTPIVAAEMGPIPEVVGREGAAALVPVGDPDQIAEKAIRILTDPDLSRQMITKGKERTKLFSWEEAGAKLGQLYRECLEVRV